MAASIMVYTAGRSPSQSIPAERQTGTRFAGTTNSYFVHRAREPTLRIPLNSVGCCLQSNYPPGPLAAKWASATSTAPACPRRPDLPGVRALQCLELSPPHDRRRNARRRPFARLARPDAAKSHPHRRSRLSRLARRACAGRHRSLARLFRRDLVRADGAAVARRRPDAASRASAARQDADRGGRQVVRRQSPRLARHAAAVWRADDHGGVAVDAGARPPTSRSRCSPRRSRSLDAIVFVQSRIAMLDIFLIAFCVLALAAFTAGENAREAQRRDPLAYASPAIVWGSPAACKWSGWFLALGLIALKLVVALLRFWRVRFENPRPGDFYAPDEPGDRRGRRNRGLSRRAVPRLFPQLRAADDPSSQPLRVHRHAQEHDRHHDRHVD